MGNVKLTITIMLQALLAFSIYGFSLNAFADDAALPTKGAAEERYKVELIRDKDYKCIQCHKRLKTDTCWLPWRGRYLYHRKRSELYSMSQ